MRETKKSEVDSNPQLPYIDRYVNRNGIKFYLNHSETFWYDHDQRYGIWFMANPKHYPDGVRPEIGFRFVVTRMFLAMNNIIQDQKLMAKFVYHFGFYEFKKWLNELNEVKNISNTIEYNMKYEQDFSKHVLNGEVLVPMYSEDDDRLQRIAEETLLKEYNDNRGNGKIDYEILKEMCFVPENIFDYTLNLLKESNYINEEKGLLTPLGVAYYKNTFNEILPQSKFSQTVFIALCFNTEMEKHYRDVYEPLVKEFKLNPILISNVEPTEPIDVEILNHIRTCRFMICDLTYARPSVYFEAGYGLGRGVNVIYTCREDHNSDSNDFKPEVNKVHFDVRNRKISWWKNDKLEEFKSELKDRINYFLSIQK